MTSELNDMVASAA